MCSPDSQTAGGSDGEQGEVKVIETDEDAIELKEMASRAQLDENQRSLI